MPTALQRSDWFHERDDIRSERDPCQLSLQLSRKRGVPERSQLGSGCHVALTKFLLAEWIDIGNKTCYHRPVRAIVVTGELKCGEQIFRKTDWIRPVGISPT